MLLIRGFKTAATYVIFVVTSAKASLYDTANYTIAHIFDFHTISDGILNQALSHVYREFFLLFPIDRLCRKVRVTQKRTPKINIVCIKSLH